jgi:hypothetical protein
METTSAYIKRVHQDKYNHYNTLLSTIIVKSIIHRLVFEIVSTYNNQFQKAD